MNFLIDSNTVLDFFNGKTELFSLFDDTENLFFSVVSVGELVNEFSKAEYKQDVLKIGSDFYHFLHIVNIDEQIALEFGRLKAKYPQVEDNKLWLCATAISRDFVIVSSDLEISQIKEVVVKPY